MRKSSEEFNSDKVIQNIGYLCNEELEELPYWETINNYLKRINPDELQSIMIDLVKRLIRSRAFEEGRIRNRYWQIVMDGTGLFSSRKELDGKSLKIPGARPCVQQRACNPTEKYRVPDPRY